MFSFDSSHIYVKMDGSALEKKLCFKILRLSLSSNLDWRSYIVSTFNIASKKLGALICSMKFLSSEVALNISIDLLYGLLGIVLSCLDC